MYSNHAALWSHRYDDRDTTSIVPKSRRGLIEEGDLEDQHDWVAEEGGGRVRTARARPSLGKRSVIEEGSQSASEPNNSQYCKPLTTYFEIESD
jgi:hypothetical protein